MDIKDYQLLAARTMQVECPRGEKMANAALGLAGESGEVADMIKKHLFQGHPLDLSALRKELGDILWYVAAMATAWDWDLGEIAQENIDKLLRRYPNGFSTLDSINRKD